MKLLIIQLPDDKSPQVTELLQFLSTLPFPYEEKATATITDKSGKEVPFTMPFGKHKGLPVEQVPLDYLVWALGNQVENLAKQQRGDKKVFLLSPSQEALFTAEVTRRTNLGTK